MFVISSEVFDLRTQQWTPRRAAVASPGAAGEHSAQGDTGGGASAVGNPAVNKGILTHVVDD